jgi:hypothetical protein
MQDFYGEQPFIMQNKYKKRMKNRDLIKVGVSKSFLLVFIVISLAIIFAVAYYVYGTAYKVTVKPKTYYGVYFYCGTDRTSAESVSQALVAEGGSGYVVNDGVFTVFCSLYKERGEAESVVKKQQSAAAVVEVGWQEFSIKCEDKEEAKIIREAFAFFEKSINEFVNLSLKLDKYEENDAVVYMFVENTHSKFLEFSQNISSVSISEFFKICGEVIQSSFLDGSGKSVSSRLKLVTHSLVDFCSKSAEKDV